MKSETGQHRTYTCVDTRARDVRGHTSIPFLHTLRFVTYHDTESRVCLCVRGKFRNAEVLMVTPRGWGTGRGGGPGASATRLPGAPTT